MHSHAKATASDIHNFICQRKSRSNLLRIQNVHLYSYSPLSVTRPPKRKQQTKATLRKCAACCFLKSSEASRSSHSPSFSATPSHPSPRRRRHSSARQKTDANSIAETIVLTSQNHARKSPPKTPPQFHPRKPPRRPPPSTPAKVAASSGHQPVVFAQLHSRRRLAVLQVAAGYFLGPRIRNRRIQVRVVWAG
jgi:hypothetical protein